jgi:hypothetical protein
MRLNCGEGNGVSLAGRTPRSTARIARTLINAPVCRTFLRSVLMWVIGRHGMITDRSQKHRPLTDRVEM